ncbi:hypothetical protein O6H91_07G063300 [Diphasiastrum complanatum]|uniref:Uncharacterized protein n=1 Tax=Diphasiastrum complanatum TaxID=34168 RepID=A0ACC2D6A1_DIPCM|nr:hypothetical protein O6H91_07G063300 [Diphasiastrum complanatum]
MLMPLIQNVFMENISIPAMAFVAGVNSQPPDPSEEESANIPSLSIMVQILMLGSTFIFGHILKRNKIMIINEAGAALLLGVLVGLIVRFSGKEKGFSTWIDFNERFFFYFLLPPIIFESGWSLRPRPFFKNFGAICVFAFGGTLISAFGVGILVYIFGVLHWTHEMPFLVCLTFGALISATDPVTVLAIFHELGADANLYAYVFGESVLNDAVAITMFKTVLSFMTNPTSNGGILGAFSFFIAIFVGSFSIGVLAGMLSALLFKYGGFQEKGLSILESCLVVLFPYLSYMMADALDLSGIVAILFAGITMKYYTAPNLSLQAQQITTSFFGMLAKLSETFVFIYVGVATFLEKQSWHNFGFTFVTILSILISRAWNVYTCSALVNCLRKKSQRIPFNHQHALWYSGLRGAMAFALALQSVTELPNDQGRVLLTSTLLTIFFTVLLVGGSTPYVLHLLQIECRGPDHDSQKEEDSKEESADQVGWKDQIFFPQQIFNCFMMSLLTFDKGLSNSL